MFLEMVEDELLIREVLLSPENRPAVPGDAHIICDQQEGHFRCVVWYHRLTDVHGVTFIGRQERAAWNDESNSMAIVLKACRIMDQLRPRNVVWDFAWLDSLSSDALANLDVICHQLGREASCAVVLDPTRRAPIVVTELFIRPLLASSTDEAIGCLYLTRCPMA